MNKKIYGIVIVALCTLGLTGYALAANPGDLIINEVMQNPSAVYDSNGEWFEIYNTTGAGIDIDGWTIKDDGTDSHIINNGGALVVPATGFLVLGNNSDSGTNGGYTCDYQFSGISLGNGADELILDDGTKAEIARIEWDGGTVWPDPNGASMAFMGTPAENNDGSKWDEECTTTYGDGDYGTPGAANTGCPTVPVPDTLTIYEIQYTTVDSGDCYDSPYLDSLVVTSGIVTAAKAGGYWLQDGAAQWCGVYVYDYGFTPNVGDSVKIQCTVAEYYGLTELAEVDSLTVLSSGNALPTPLDVLTGTLAGGCEADAEPYEGCLVKVTEVMCTADLDGNNQWWVDDGSGACEVDDDLYFYDPYVGEEFDFIIGICDYSYGEYEVLPRMAEDLNVTPQPDTLSIYEIQYVAAPPKADCFPSSHVGETVVTSGIVHAVKYDGTFWIQEAEAEWSGVYVFESGLGVSVGDEVQVEGVVAEYSGLTEIGSVSDHTILTTGNALFNPLDIVTTTLSAEDSCAYPGEPYEGVLVRVTDVQCTALGLYGQWYVNENAKAEACEVDDDLYNLYTPVVGQNFDYIIGMVDYSYGQFEILPRDEFDIGEAVAIELMSFDAAAGDGQVTLTWATASEVDNHSFNIYRDDEIIATVPAAGEAHEYMYVDRKVTNGVTYSYKLSDVDLDGIETIHETVLTVTPMAIPTDYALHQNYPNPFNPTTEIRYDVREKAHVTLKIYNVSGAKVATLVASEHEAGQYKVQWDATDMASGVYFCTMKAGDFEATKKMVFLK
jgi:hypothetical protein